MVHLTAKLMSACGPAKRMGNDVCVRVASAASARGQSREDGSKKMANGCARHVPMKRASILIQLVPVQVVPHAQPARSRSMANLPLWAMTRSVALVSMQGIYALLATRS
jgi:hypothetical protein